MFNEKNDEVETKLLHEFQTLRSSIEEDLKEMKSLRSSFDFELKEIKKEIRELEKFKIRTEASRHTKTTIITNMIRYSPFILALIAFAVEFFYFKIKIKP